MRDEDRELRVRNWVIGAIVLLAVAALLMLWNRERLFGRPTTAPATAERPPVATPPPPATVGATGGPLLQPAAVPTAPAASVGDVERRWTALLGRPPQWPEDLSSPRSCEEVDQALDAVCAALDRRPYLAPLASMGGACPLLEQVAAELATRSPSLASELRSYESILGNVFHLFRVLGRERMSLLRRILEEERELVEPLALTLHRWLVSREDCLSGPTPIRLAALYEYAGFLFNTMGGQAYMRRRTPQVEALACFYGLEILDLAARSGHNPHGIDPRPELGRCRALIASQPLALSRHYLASLDAIARRWEIAEP